MRPRFKKEISDSGIAYTRQGRGVRLLLIHGVGLRAESWFPYLDQLSHNFDLFIIDLPGHGQSETLDRTFQEIKVGDYVCRIESFMTEFDDSPLLVCGHSLGSLIAIEMAANKNSNIIGLAALNSIYRRSNTAARAVKQRAEQMHSSKSIAGVSQTIERWFGKMPSPEMQPFAELCSHWLYSNDLQAYALSYKAFADSRGPSIQQLGHIACESTFMTGILDPNSTPRMTFELAKQVTGAQTRIIDAGHMMPLTHAKLVCEELLKLAKRTEQTSLPIQTTALAADR